MESTSLDSSLLTKTDYTYLGDLAATYSSARQWPFGPRSRGIQRGDFVVQNSGNRELDCARASGKRDVCFGPQQFHTAHPPALGKRHSHLLSTDGIEIPDPSAVHGGVRVIEDMHGKPGLRLPRERLDHSVALDRDWRIRTRHPANRVLEQPRQVGVAGSPHGALNIAREVD